MLVDSNLVMLS